MIAKRGIHTLAYDRLIGCADRTGVVKPVNIDIGIGRRRFNSTFQHSSSALANVHTIHDCFHQRQFCIRPHTDNTSTNYV